MYTRIISTEYNHVAACNKKKSINKTSSKLTWQLSAPAIIRCWGSTHLWHHGLTVTWVSGFLTETHRLTERKVRNCKINISSCFNFKLFLNLQPWNLKHLWKLLNLIFHTLKESNFFRKCLKSLSLVQNTLRFSSISGFIFYLIPWTERSFRYLRLCSNHHMETTWEEWMVYCSLLSRAFCDR